MTESRYLSADKLAEYLCISRSMVGALVKAGRLPEPVYLTSRLPRWDREKVDRAMGSAVKSDDKTLGNIDAWFDRNGAPPPQGR